MKITPSARVLRMLGEIEFAEWQCIAELVDNAFDDFAEIETEGIHWPDGYTVAVSLPTQGLPIQDAAIEVRDSGRGMTPERLELAVRAGWSSNDQFDKLGLFGMGFNVSTARLGRLTRVLTTRAGDDEWIGVEIDLDAIGDDFEAPEIREAKDDPSEHGTRIVVSRLDRDRADWLTRNAQALRKQLGQVYGWLLDERNYELRVNGVKVRPRRPCAWSDQRYVTYGAGKKSEQIPAVIHIDQAYASADTCLVCGNWQDPGLGVCDQCRSPELRQRERRVHGWIGIQRYLDRSDYGVDFLRNGRKILVGYKGLFEWSNPNDPLASVRVEYPVELGQGGRIVGEIHLDHVPVQYQKNAFEFSDRQWKLAIQFLRGVGPMLPQSARDFGYEENNSPVARLIRGYRRNDAGRRCLVPGDGTSPLHEKARAWAQRYFAGEEDYQSDEIWWNAVVEHERVKEASTQARAELAGASRPDEDAVLAALGIDGGSDAPDVTPPNLDADPPRIETAFARIARYREAGTRIEDLSGDIGSPSVGFTKLATYLVDREPVVGNDGERTAVLATPGAGGSTEAFIDAHHPLFAKFGWSARQVLLTELTDLLKVRSESSRPKSSLLLEIVEASFPDSAISTSVVGEEARELLRDIRSLTAQSVAAEPARAYQYLTSDEITATENSLIAGGGHLPTVTETDTRFIEFAPPLYLVRLLEEWPESMMDGEVFMHPYRDLVSRESKRLAVRSVASLLTDVALAASEARPGAMQLQRYQLSIALLRNSLGAVR